MTAGPQTQTEASTATPSTNDIAGAVAEIPPAPLSKNAQKKLARAARIAEQKKERRAYEKEKKKEKKRELAAKRAAGELDEEEAGGPRKKARTEGPRIPFNARIVVDLGFDDMMNENEVKSLANQLGYTYNANKKSSRPFASLLFTGLNGRTFTHLESLSDAAYKRWKDTEWWHEGYERLWEGMKAEVAQAEGGKEAKSPEGEGEAVDGHLAATEGSVKAQQSAPRESVVYLTADSTDELSELKEGETYIIGGICDHNRYKNLCLNKAEASKIRTARLPIGTYLAELKTRKVLTVNQTFEILLKWVETRDWKVAFEEVIPKRKFNEQGRKRGGSAAPSSAPAKDEEAQEEVDGESRRVIVDVNSLQDDNLTDDGTDESEAMGDVPVAGGELGTLVAAPPDTEMTNENGPAISMDDAHPEVPPNSDVS